MSFVFWMWSATWKTPPGQEKQARWEYQVCLRPNDFEINCSHLRLQLHFSGRRKTNRQKVFVQLCSRTKLAICPGLRPEIPASSNSCMGTHLLLNLHRYCGRWSYHGQASQTYWHNFYNIKSTRSFLLFTNPVKDIAYRWTFKFKWWHRRASVQ